MHRRGCCACLPPRLGRGVLVLACTVSFRCGCEHPSIVMVVGGGARGPRGAPRMTHWLAPTPKAVCWAGAALSVQLCVLNESGSGQLTQLACRAQCRGGTQGRAGMSMGCSGALQGA